ncbi:CRISPR-associated endonuclease Cas1 [Thiothrix litoralis]|jgi:CRISPR-associated protein Cas1|uniref:CRISPR-associated endonuclease Cas1 n=1 Tax=Thiothrix litoralis TaxID=2891210 RepID=A0ABX7WN75_9GAMM|nr:MULTISPECIES: CRISPR-associated endonuclease Cas1 [Thiothrix]QTR44845.1 CRISPR-associated endonuclease Cas1 [Thiothrix litoralis]WMP16508.1 CRISPR-associated endonuclease Cas1 [Thiothrix lacustris]
MTTLYIDHKNATLEVEGATLVARLGDRRQRPVPLALLERVVCLTNVQLDTTVLGTLAENGIAFSIASQRKPQRRAVLLGSGHNDASIRLLHYRLAQNPDWRLAFTRQLLAAKFAAHSRLLGDMLTDRPDQRKAITDAQQQLAAQQANLPTAAGLASLLGMEGAAARAVFGAFGAVLPAALGFAGRKRRPPPDPVNATLSLAYTMLHNRAVQIIHAHGLEPLLGFYHETSFGRESLASDLIEVWRPHIDAWVWESFRSQTLRVGHFKTDTNGCFLDKSGRQVFFAGLEGRLRPLSRAMRWQVRGLVQAMREWEVTEVAV